jgi:hypothetical protein
VVATQPLNFGTNVLTGCRRVGYQGGGGSGRRAERVSHARRGS